MANITAGIFFIRITLVIPIAKAQAPNTIFIFSLKSTLKYFPNNVPNIPPIIIDEEQNITPIGIFSPLIHDIYNNAIFNLCPTKFRKKFYIKI